MDNINKAKNYFYTEHFSFDRSTLSFRSEGNVY